MMLTDTHTHIYDEAFDSDRAEVMGRAFEAGVERIFMPAIDSQSHNALFDVCNDYPDNCFAMMGLHPTSVNDNPDWREELAIVERYLKEPPAKAGKFWAVGEVGLDLHWSKDWLPEQMEVLRKQIELSLKYDLPLVIHTRDAWEEMTEVLAGYRERGIRGVMHAYSGSYSDYLQIKQYGDFLFGIGGVVTYKNSKLEDLVRQMNLDDIVLETDAPYLTPAPFRGKRNEPSYIKYICRKIAEIRNTSVEEVARVTTQNSVRMFGV